MTVAVTASASSSSSTSAGDADSTHRSPGSPAATRLGEAGRPEEQRQCRCRRDTFARSQYRTGRCSAVYRGPHRRPRDLRCRMAHPWTVRPARRRPVARPPATARDVRRPGCRRGTGPRVRRRNWAGSPPGSPSGEFGQAVVGDHGGVFDAVARAWLPAPRNAAIATTSWAAVTQCSATGIPPSMVAGDPAVSSSRSSPSSCRMRLPGARRAPLTATRRIGALQVGDVASAEIRCGVGDPRDPKTQPARTRPASVGRSARPTRVRAAQHPVGVIGQADPVPARRCSGSTAPRCGAARAPASAATPRPAHGAVQRARGGLVIADGSDPAVFISDRRQSTPLPGPSRSAHLGRADADRMQAAAAASAGGCGGRAGQVSRCRPRRRAPSRRVGRQSGGHLDDLLADPDVRRPCRRAAPRGVISTAPAAVRRATWRPSRCRRPARRPGPATAVLPCSHFSTSGPAVVA